MSKRNQVVTGCLSILLCIVSTGVAWADDELPVDARGVAQVAEVIARVEIESRKAATFVYDGKEETCGYTYRARVVEAIKGSADNFEFFSRHRASVSTTQYLVLAVRPTPEAADLLEDVARSTYSGEKQRRELCAIRFDKLVVSDDPLMLIGFDRELEQQTGEPWLQRKPGNLLWLASAFPHTDFEVSREIRSGVRWAEAKRVLRGSAEHQP